MSYDHLRAANCRLGRSIFAHFLGDESKTSIPTGFSVFEATALLWFTFSWPCSPMVGASELSSFTPTSMETSPSPSKPSCPSLYATKSAVANSCFLLRFLTVSKQKGHGYVKRSLN